MAGTEEDIVEEVSAGTEKDPVAKNELVEETSKERDEEKVKDDVEANFFRTKEQNRLNEHGFRKDQGEWAMMRAKLWSRFPFKDSFVFVPMLSMISNVIVASILSLVRSTDNPELISKGLRMIGMVSNASISIVTLTFSLTVLSVQLASQSYSPRLLDEFIKDPVSKVVISVNLGAYAFCFTSLYFIDEDDPFPEVPFVNIHLLAVHACVVLITFVNFIHFFIQGFRIETILRRASSSSLQAARALSSKVSHELEQEIKVPNRARKVLSTSSGYVTRFRLDKLVQTAHKLDVCVRYNLQAGEFVNKGTVMCYIWDTKSEGSEKDLYERLLEGLSCRDDADDEDVSPSEQLTNLLELFCSQGLEISLRRSSDYDVTLGIQQLADIAVRALSPGVNDPHTAIQCMDVLEPLLAELSTMTLGVPNARDDDGIVRACAPRRSFSHLCSMLDGIRVYGGNDLTVCRRGLRLFGDLGFILSRSHKMDRFNTALDQLEQWNKVSSKNFETGSPEMASLTALYDHLLRTIADAEIMTVKGSDGDDVRDLQAFETTFRSQAENEADAPDFSIVAMNFLREWTNSKPTTKSMMKKSNEAGHEVTKN